MAKATIVSESYSEYLATIDNRVKTSDTLWIKNIIDGTAECDRVLYRSSEFVIVKDSKWTNNKWGKFHLLAIPTKSTLRTIRDLTEKDVSMLLDIYQMSIHVVLTNSNVQAKNIRMYMSYDPSTYHFHVHVVHGSNCRYRQRTNKEKFDLKDVITNIIISDNYYQSKPIWRKVLS